MPSMEDLRVKKTKLAIENAMMELIEIKGYSKVKIIDIANKAQVNRNTIYLHYQSKEDIILSILERHHGELNIENKIIDFIKLKGQKSDIHRLFSDLINSIEQNIELYRILLTDHNLNGFLNYRINKVRDYLLKGLSGSPKNVVYLDYMISGTNGVISKWVIYAIAKKEEVIDELTEITYKGLNMIE